MVLAKILCAKLLQSFARTIFFLQFEALLSGSASISGVSKVQDPIPCDLARNEQGSPVGLRLGQDVAFEPRLHLLQPLHIYACVLLPV